MISESNQNVFLIQIDASSFAEFEISEFEISGIDCTVKEGIAHLKKISCQNRDILLNAVMMSA